MPEILNPVFVLCQDGRFYEDLVYQDFPERRSWFIVFDRGGEPPELVVREDWYRSTPPEAILKHRGFSPKLITRLVNGRKDPHKRFFGTDENGLPTHEDTAISWFLMVAPGIPWPTPNKYDSCVRAWPVFPNRPGKYYGGKP